MLLHRFIGLSELETLVAGRQSVHEVRGIASIFSRMKVNIIGLPNGNLNTVLG